MPMGTARNEKGAFFKSLPNELFRSPRRLATGTLGIYQSRAGKNHFLLETNILIKNLLNNPFG
jgi:hypothetical protein